MKKILIVDDSLVYRHALTSGLSEESSFTVVGSAKNGQEALDYIVKNQVDLITLDIEMPVMDGFQLISKLKQLPTHPRIIVFTSMDSSGAGNAMKALHLGADDFVGKIEGSGDINESIKEVKSVLTPKIKSLLNLKTNNEQSNNSTPAAIVSAPEIAKNLCSIKKIKTNYEYIFIGTSTGGPEALRTIFNSLNGVKMPPILIVQHMPPIYTTYLAQALNENSTYNVAEAKNGDIVKAGHCYIAPGDFHMEVVTDESNVMKIVLHQKEKECFVRPCVNYLFRTAASVMNKSLFVVLTGMGNDGLEGVKFLSNKNSDLDILIQDEESSVVWGMPGEVYQSKIYSEIQNLTKIKETIAKIIK